MQSLEELPDVRFSHGQEKRGSMRSMLNHTTSVANPAFIMALCLLIKPVCGACFSGTGFSGSCRHYPGPHTAFGSDAALSLRTSKKDSIGPSEYDQVGVLQGTKVAMTCYEQRRCQKFSCPASQ